MDCPNCGTFNPEGRTTCWRCNKELPKQAPPKRRDPTKGARTWLYVAVAAMVLATLAQMCGWRLPWSSRATPAPGGALPRSAPIAWLVQSDRL